MEKNLFLACFLMFGLHAAVLVILFVKRVRDVRSKTTDPRYYKTYDLEANVPVVTRQLSRNYVNLFEAPVLFYAIIALILALGLQNAYFVPLAYAYVACRVVHSLIHTTVNKVYPRLAAFMASWVVLAALWINAFRVLN